MSSPLNRSALAGAILTIDLGALQENYRRLKAHLQGAACAAVVKADGYGLGAAVVASALREVGCRSFVVAHAVEGVALREQTGIAYDERSRGTLQLFRTQAQVDGTGGDIEVLKQFGVPFELLDAAGCIEAEPALARVREKIKGGLRLPGDETGDCKLFTERLAAICRERGVSFRFGVETGKLWRNSADTEVLSVKAGTENIRADAYVMALGSYSARWMRKRHVPIPVYPIKGYSITFPVTNADAAPVSTIMDESYKIAITRLGDRIRVGGTAEVSGYDLTLHETRRATLEHSVQDLFPDAGSTENATFWCGLRPMTPDGPPIIGPTRYKNLFVNTGHGTLGWTMACGSGKVLADIMSGRTPDIDASELGMERYR